MERVWLAEEVRVASKRTTVGQGFVVFLSRRADHHDVCMGSQTGIGWAIVVLVQMVPWDVEC